MLIAKSLERVRRGWISAEVSVAYVERSLAVIAKGEAILAKFDLAASGGPDANQHAFQR